MSNCDCEPKHDVAEPCKEQTASVIRLARLVGEYAHQLRLTGIDSEIASAMAHDYQRFLTMHGRW